MSVPFQKTITIHKERVEKKTTRFFLCCYQDNLQTAMKTLSHTGFKVYLSLLFNRDGYCIDFSPAYVSQITSLCLDTARKGLKELIQKNYLVPANDKETIFNFYETPRANGSRMEIVDEYTGQIYDYSFEELKNDIGLIEASKIWRKNGGNLI